MEGSATGQVRHGSATIPVGKGRGHSPNGPRVARLHPLSSSATIMRVTSTCEAARQDVFGYIEMFYDPKRKHTNSGMLSTVDFETK
jgi:hypothetical protein